MHTRIDAVIIAAIWLSAAAVVAGFLLPWASLDMKYRDVIAGVDGVVRELPMGAAAERLTQRLGRIAIHVKRGAEEVTGELPDLATIPTRVNGPQIPQLVNRPDAHVVVALAELFTGARQLGKKSYAVYALPVLAIALALLLTVAGHLRAVAVSAGLAGLAIGGGALVKLLTTPTDSLLVTITIESGLWMTAWAYAALGLLAWLRLVAARRS